MENQNNPKETETPETAPTSPSPASPAVAAESPPWSPPPPPSLSSSPSHEFSFTISFHAPNSLAGSTSSAAAATAVKLSKSTAYPLDFDLSPADDIFFNGHLLPLHFVSHRPSDVSIYNTNFLPCSHIETEYVESSNTAAAAAAAAASVSTSEDFNGRSIHKSFPIFWLRKWLKGNDGEENRVDEKQRNKRQKKKKKAFDFAMLWKKYTNLVEPLIFLKGWKEKREIRRRSSQFSFSGDSQRRRWHGGMSAPASIRTSPASIRTSPANSGLLVTPPANNFSSEELKNAIQAAIVHCKNSIEVEED